MKIYEIGTGYTSIPAKVPAATESIVEELTKAFAESNIQVEIIDVSDKNRAVCSLPIIEVKVPSFFTKSDVSLGIVHKLKRVVYSIALSRKLKKIIKNSTEKVVLHFHNQYNLFFFTKLVSKKIRDKAFIAYTNHNGMWSLPYEEAKDTIKKRYFQEITAMENSDVVIALNSKMRDNISANINIADEKVVLVYNGVNTDIYKPLSKEEKEAAKEKAGLTGKRVILQIGSVYENKGQERAIRYLSSLLKKHDDLVYAFVGGIVSQEYYEKVLATAKDLKLEDKVVYLGSVSPGVDMNQIYNIADASIFCSNYESFGLVCIESLSAGVPVVLCGESVVDFGEGCLLCTEEELLSVVSENVLADTERSHDLAVVSRENALKNFTWKKIAQDYLSAFNKTN